MSELESDWESYYSDEWWIEYLEQELDPSLSEDMKRLLKTSPGDRCIHESFSKVRQLVKACDDVFLSEDGRYYEGLYERIMAGIEERSKSPKGTGFSDGIDHQPDHQSAPIIVAAKEKRDR